MFYYFIPTTAHKTKLPRSVLAEYYLDAVIDTPIIAPIDSGPDQRPGLIVVDASLSKTAIRYLPAAQTWTQSIDTDAWIGHDGTTPPPIASLVRDRTLPGGLIHLDDGQAFLVPHARRYREIGDAIVPTIALPQSLGRDRSTKAWLPKSVIPRYRPLWDLLVAYIETQDTAIAAADADDDSPIYFEFAGLHDLAIAAINVNYRIAADELELLGVYNQQLTDAIIRILTDRDNRDALVKKKLAALVSATSNSSPGPGPSTPDTPTPTPQP